MRVSWHSAQLERLRSALIKDELWYQILTAETTTHAMIVAAPWVVARFRPIQEVMFDHDACAQSNLFAPRWCVWASLLALTCCVCRACRRTPIPTRLHTAWHQGVFSNFSELKRLGVIYFTRLEPLRQLRSRNLFLGHVTVAQQVLHTRHFWCHSLQGCRMYGPNTLDGGMQRCLLCICAAPGQSWLNL